MSDECSDAASDEGSDDASDEYSEGASESDWTVEDHIQDMINNPTSPELLPESATSRFNDTWGSDSTTSSFDDTPSPSPFAGRRLGLRACEIPTRVPRTHLQLA